ncbi:MAG TPA: hypothetical protein VLZ76_03825 [Lysobacter sp.]|nr:hypothetical protein [Lysobacter sp.]
MSTDDTEFDPDDNFANSLQVDAGIDPDADDTPEALVWQLLLLINPGDEESALQQFSEYRDALAETDPDEAEPVWLLKDVIDWKAGFYVDGTDAVSFIDTITELAARWNLRIDWGVEDASDEDFLADADVPSLMAVAYDRLREYGYSLWTWNAANGPSGDEDMQAGWITLSSDDEAMQELAHALNIELRPGSDPFH